MKSHRARCFLFYPVHLHSLLPAVVHEYILFLFIPGTFIVLLNCVCLILIGVVEFTTYFADLRLRFLFHIWLRTEPREPRIIFQSPVWALFERPEILREKTSQAVTRVIWAFARNFMRKFNYSWWCTSTSFAFEMREESVPTKRFFSH